MPPVSSHRRRPARPAELPPRVLAGLLGVLALGCAVYLFASDRSEGRLKQANELGLQGRYAEAARTAATIRSGPAAGRASAVVAYADWGAHDLAGASRAFAQAIVRSPSDWTLRSDWAATLLGLGRRSAARGQMELALTLNPQLALRPGFCRAAPGAHRVVLC